MTGVGMVALPAGILASAFSERLRVGRRRYETAVTEALADDVITREEKIVLDRLCNELGLSPDDAESILRREAARRSLLTSE